MTATVATPERVVQQPSRRRRGRQAVYEPRSRFAHLIMGVGLLYFLVPLVWILIAATKSQVDLLSTPALSFTDSIQLWDNLQKLFKEDDGAYGRWLANTAIYSGVSAVGATAISAVAGYGLARFRFRGKALLESALLGMIMVPATALVMPTYLLLTRMNLVNTRWAVILPSLLSPFGAYLIRVYVAASVPQDLLDAARIDRASEARVFFQVALPLMRPAIVTVFLFTLVATWNNYFLPLVMLSDSKLYPITVGLTTWFNTANMEAGTRVLFNLVVTGALLAIVPLIIAFVLLQRFWRGGVSTGSLK